MASTSIGDIKKKTRKRSSPFRIKVGYVVALRFRPRENQMQLVGPDGKLMFFNDLGGGDCSGNMLAYKEPVVSAQFSEVWTDPQPGVDDGLALIGNRIRCFFPKAVLSDPYNATSRLLQGEVVNVVNYEKQYYQMRSAWRDERSSIGLLVDLLIDNDGDKQIKALPFLQRVDDVLEKDQLMAASNFERQSYMNELRIKGGPNKTIVRVLLSDELLSGIPKKQLVKKREQTQLPLQAKWVIRKRVLAKIIRGGPSVGKMKGNDSVFDNKNQIESRKVPHRSAIDPLNGDANGDSAYASESTGFATTDNEAISPKKKRKVTFNKDFSVPRYLGDGNDQPAQQEVNWRWQAARFNPSSILADRPLSKELLSKLCYNFVGEVIRIEPQVLPEATSLATVTIRRLVLPEHTLTGRLPSDGPCVLFDDDDLRISSFQETTNGAAADFLTHIAADTTRTMSLPGDALLLRVPIEDLVIVSRKVVRAATTKSSELFSSTTSQADVRIRYSYSFHTDMFTSNIPLKGGDSETLDLKRCCRCHHLCDVTKSLCGVSPHYLCEPCFGIARTRTLLEMGEEKVDIHCDCDGCIIQAESTSLLSLSAGVADSAASLGDAILDLGEYSATKESGFMITRFITKGLVAVAFASSPFSLQSFATSSESKPIVKVKANVRQKRKKLASLSISRRVGRNSLVHQIEGGQSASSNFQATGGDVFKATSARTLTYNVRNRKFDVSAADLYQWKLSLYSKKSIRFPEEPRNIRLVNKPHLEDESASSAGEKLVGRASRAKRRRLARSVAPMGVSVDILAGREQQLRFDRSAIHDWGVFVDIDVPKDDMIVEYRGEIIGNAMAEKREKEYIDAKIGSDYMFRIDDYIVCDATKQGNVARFINASCDPNCCTKIISLDGTKRIVIYAKRDIRAGEELCYDYKFSFEPDPSKRIPCRCAARECRGFLNWDKRREEVQSFDESDTK